MSSFWKPISSHDTEQFENVILGSIHHDFRIIGRIVVLPNSPNIFVNRQGDQLDESFTHWCRLSDLPSPK